MQRCPNCNLMIAHLKSITTEEYHHIVRLPVDGSEVADPGYDGETGLVWVEDLTISIVEDRFECPECHKEIVHSNEEAAKFLKGG